MTHVKVQRELLQWARERSGMDEIALSKRVPQLKTWERGDKQPTFKQLESFAKATNTPLGFLFLPAPPEEKLPIRDLRTVKDKPSRPSPDLLDTIYAMQRRQDWMREERVDAEAGPLEFVGSARLNDDPQAVGQEMRRAVGVADEWAAQVANWQEAVSELRRRFEGLGVMTVINGGVLSADHAHRLGDWRCGRLRRPNVLGEQRMGTFARDRSPFSARSHQVWPGQLPARHVALGRRGRRRPLF